MLYTLYNYTPALAIYVYTPVIHVYTPYIHLSHLQTPHIHPIYTLYTPLHDRYHETIRASKEECVNVPGIGHISWETIEADKVGL